MGQPAMTEDNHIYASLIGQDKLSSVLEKVTGNTKRFTQAWKDADKGISYQVTANAKGIQGVTKSWTENGQKIRQVYASIVPEVAKVSAEAAKAPSGGLLGAVVGLGATGLITGALAAVAAVLGTVNKAKDSLLEAASIQTTMLATAGDISETVGVSMGQAKSLLKETTSALTKIAADQPGKTQDYTDFAQAVSPSLGKLFRGDPKRFQEETVDLSKRVGFLGAKYKISGFESGNTVNRLISGTMGFGEASQLDLLQKNSLFSDKIREGTQALGLNLENWKEFTIQQRAAIVMAAAKMSTPDSLIKEFQGTADSTLEAIQTALFNPLEGVFGVMRGIQGRGNRSALDAFTGLLDAFMALGSGLGQYKDLPMTLLIDFLDWLRDGLKALKALAGKPFDGFVAGLLDALRGTIAAVDWLQVGTWLGKAVIGAFTALGQLMLSPSFWESAIKVLVVGLGAAFSVVVGILAGILEAPARDLANGIKGLFGWIGDLLGINKGPVSQGQKTGFDGILAAPDKPLGFDLGITKPVDSPLGLPMTPKGQTAPIFAPQVSVNTTSNASAEDISGSIVQKLDGMFRVYKEGQLR